MRKRLLLALVLLVGTLAMPAVALADMGPPWLPGDVVGEPRGGTKAIAIVREDLAIDLRPLATGKAAQVTATYHVQNDGPAQSLGLVFLATSLANKGEAPPAEVTLDGVAVPSAATTQEVLPDTWQPPETTPSLGGGPDLYYETSSGHNHALAFALAPGAHAVRVTYPAVATAYSGDSPVRYWQLGYVLAPARDWASFGGLDVKVDLPAGWSAATRPALARSGDALAGSFETVPADALAITTQAPVPVSVNVLPAAWGGGALACVLIGALVGRWLGHRRRSSLWALIPSLLVGVAWLVVALAAASVLYVGDVPEGQGAWVYGYGERMLGTMASPLALVFGIVLTQVAAVVARRLVKPLPAPSRVGT